MKVGDDVRFDSYHWLHDENRTDQRVYQYLKDENKYTGYAFKDQVPLFNRVSKELARIVHSSSRMPPLRMGTYQYYARLNTEQTDLVHSRRRLPKDHPPPLETDALVEAPDEDIYDHAREKENVAGYVARNIYVSPDQELMAIVMQNRRERFLQIRNLTSSEDLLTWPIKRVDTVAWASNGRALFYSTLDHKKRPAHVWRMDIDVSLEDPTLVFTEGNVKFSVRVEPSRSNQMLFIISESSATTKTLYLDASNPTGSWKWVLKPRPNTQYAVADRLGDIFVMAWSSEWPNGLLQLLPANVLTAAPSNGTCWSNLRTLTPHRRHVALERGGLLLTQNHLVVMERVTTPSRAVVYRLPSGRLRGELQRGRRMVFRDPTTVSNLLQMGDFNSSVVRFLVSSPITPNQYLDFNLDTSLSEVKSRDEVTEGWDPTLYESSVEPVHTLDNRLVSVTLVYRRDLVTLNGSAPAHVRTSGAQRQTGDPRFDMSIISLLDRGIVFADLCVRGGGARLDSWELQGKPASLDQAAADVLAGVRHLVRNRVAHADRITIEASEAGALAAAAAINKFPNKFRGAVLDRPLLDVLTALTEAPPAQPPICYGNWGEPLTSVEVYNSLKNASPQDNIAAQAYPNMLLIAAYKNPTFGYWEAAKYVAKLRSLKVNQNKLLLWTDLGGKKDGEALEAFTSDALRVGAVLHFHGLDTHAGKVTASSSGNT